MGFAAGLQAGERLGQGILDAYNQSREQRGIREAKGLTAKEIEQREATPDEIGRARAEAQAMSAQDAEVFGLTPEEQVAYAPQMPVQGQRIGLSRYQVGQQMFDRAPTQQEIDRVRQYAMADVIAERDPAAGLRMRREIDLAKRQDEMYPLERQRLEGALELQNVQTQGARTQGKLTDVQLADALRKQTKQQAFDTGYDEINKQKFEKPEDRTAAILDLIELTQGVEERQRLQASYTTTELNNLTLQAKKFEEGYRQSRAKGVVSALEWFDEQNTSFKLERDPKNPFRYIQVNQDGTRSVFADAKSERELGMLLDAKAKPGGWLELSKYELDVKKAGDLENYYSKISTGRGVTSLKQQVADFKEVFGRDPTDEEKGIMAKLINKESNKPEFNPKDYAATVKSFTDAGFSPADALIRADQLYGRGPAAGKEDVDLQAADKAKGAKTNAPAEKVGLTTQPADKAAPAPAAQPPRPPNTVEAIQAANLQKLVPLANEFKAAEQQFIAAARSGDQKAIAQYLQKKEVLRQQLESQLEKQFGNTAPAAYKQLLSLGS